MFALLVDVELYLLLGNLFQDKIAAKTLQKNARHVLLATFEPIPTTLNRSSEILTERPWKWAWKKHRDFWKDAILEGEISFGNSKNQTITRVLVPYERISGRKNHPITSLGGDSVQHLPGGVQKSELAPGSIPSISIDLVGKISFLTIFTHSVWYLAMRELKSKQNATPNRSQRLQMSQLVSCVEHGFGLWFVKLYS